MCFSTVDAEGFGSDLPRAQAHKQMTFSVRSSSPLIRTARAAGKRHAATHASRVDNQAETTECNIVSGGPPSKLAGAFSFEFQQLASGGGNLACSRHLCRRRSSGLESRLRARLPAT